MKSVANSNLGTPRSSVTRRFKPWVGVNLPGNMQGYSVTDLHTAYASPGATQDLGKSYNLEQELTRLTLLGTGRVFDVTRDGGGRVTGSASAESSQAFTYADATGRVAKATNTQGSNSQVSQFTYNGPLVTAFSTSGVANGVFTYTFDNDFWVSNIVFDNGAVTLPIVRDGDGLMTQYSDFTLDRSGPLGAPISITQGNGQWQKSYDNLGRLQSEALKVGGNVKLQFDYAYNTAGRLISRIETESTGNIRTVLFTYDRDGQLLEVSENGVSTESNAYDVNGNRTSRKAGANTRAANYDAKDRLIAQGGVNYVFDADGFLKSRGSDTFTYGTRGELLSANVGGVAVSYVYDTQARLVARIQGGSKIEYLYGNLGEPFQLTAVKEAGVLTYHHYDPSGRLMAFDRGGARYFVQTEYIGWIFGFYRRQNCSMDI